VAKGVDTKHPEYQAQIARWRRCQDCVDGEDVVKQRGAEYLPVLEGQKGENSKSYKAYLKRATFYPAMGRTVTGLSGLVMRRAPVLDKVPDAVMPHVRDLTLTGQSLSVVATNALQAVLTKGRAALAIDWAGEDSAKGRPYWALYRAEAIVNWRTEIVAGQPVTVLVVLEYQAPLEVPGDAFTHATETRWRVWQLEGRGEGARCVVTTWRKPRANESSPTSEFIAVDQPMTPTHRGRPLWFIPVVPINASPDLGWATEKPPLLDLADMVLSHYRSSADLEHGAHFTALPVPYVTGWAGDDEKLQMGSGAAWLITNPDAKVGMLEYMGQGLKALESRCDDKEKKMAVLGARMLEAQPSVQETAEAVKLRHTAEHASLVGIVDSVQLAIETVLRWHVWWVTGQDDPDASVSLNRDFMSLRISPQELTALVQLCQAGKISSETLYYNLQAGEIARPGVSWEEEQEAIDAEEPEPEPDPPADPDNPDDPGADPDNPAPAGARPPQPGERPAGRPTGRPGGPSARRPPQAAGR